MLGGEEARAGGGTSAMSPLARAVREIEAHAAESGWDQPARLYALVPTDELVTREPRLIHALGLDAAASAGSLTPVEQEPLPPDRRLEDVLAGIVWPEEVLGAAAVIERVVLPPAAEAHMPEEPGEAERFAAQHPDRQEVRMAAGVLRDGNSHCVLRMRAHEDALLEGDTLVPGLVGMLAHTMQD
jgi:hypothetical protein